MRWLKMFDKGIIAISGESYRDVSMDKFIADISLMFDTPSMKECINEINSLMSKIKTNVSKVDDTNTIDISTGSIQMIAKDRAGNIGLFAKSKNNTIGRAKMKVEGQFNRDIIGAILSTCDERHDEKSKTEFEYSLNTRYSLSDTLLEQIKMELISEAVVDAYSKALNVMNGLIDAYNIVTKSGFMAGKPTGIEVYTLGIDGAQVITLDRPEFDGAMLKETCFGAARAVRTDEYSVQNYSIEMDAPKMRVKSQIDAQFKLVQE